MVMDYISTPYTRDAYLDAAGRVRVTLRWYPAPPGAKLFPGWHRFASGDWSEKAPWFAWPPPGEIKESKRQFYDSRPLPPPPYTGQHFTGDLSWFQNGVPASVLAGYPCTGLPAPVNCTDNPAPVGRVRLGGSTSWTWGDMLGRPRGGLRPGGRIDACVFGITLLSRGGFAAGGQLAYSVGPLPAARPRGGSRLGGLAAYRASWTNAYPAGGSAWGGAVSWIRCLPVTSRGGSKWGGTSVGPFTPGPCLPCCGWGGASPPPRLWVKLGNANGTCTCYNGSGFWINRVSGTMNLHYEVDNEGGPLPCGALTCILECHLDGFFYLDLTGLPCDFAHGVRPTTVICAPHVCLHWSALPQLMAVGGCCQGTIDVWISDQDYPDCGP